MRVTEAAFYYAIVQNDSAILQMGDDVLKCIAVELVVQHAELLASSPGVPAT